MEQKHILIYANKLINIYNKKNKNLTKKKSMYAYDNGNYYDNIGNIKSSDNLDSSYLRVLLDKIKTIDEDDKILNQYINKSNSIILDGGNNDPPLYYNVYNKNTAYYLKSGYDHELWKKYFDNHNSGLDMWICNNDWSKMLTFQGLMKVTRIMYENDKLNKTIQYNYEDNKLNLLGIGGTIQLNFSTLTVKKRQIIWKINTFNQILAKNDDEQSFIILQYFIANRLVQQGALEIQKNSNGRISFALVCLGITNKYPTFFDYVIRELFDKCTFCVPMIPPNIESEELISKDDNSLNNAKTNYLVNVLKYKQIFNDDGPKILETEGTFGKRVAGYLSLLLTIYSIQPNNMNNIQLAFDWLKCFIQFKTNVFSPLILHTALKILHDILCITYKDVYLKFYNKNIKNYINNIPKKIKGSKTFKLNLKLLNTFMVELDKKEIGLQTIINELNEIIKDTGEYDDQKFTH